MTHHGVDGIAEHVGHPAVHKAQALLGIEGKYAFISGFDDLPVAPLAIGERLGPGLHLIRHLVESHAQHGQFIATRGRGAPVQFAFRDFPGHRDQAGNAPGQGLVQI